jgi:hypothetical protein
MYTDQAMDNLVRAYEDTAFVQLTYSQVSVNDKDSAIANVNGGEADFAKTHTTDLTKSGAAQFVRNRSFSGKFPFTGSGQRDRILSFHADPVTDQNYIYESYLAFAKNPALFMTSTEKPSCSVHIIKKCKGKWYWIPIEAGPSFLELVVTTSFVPPNAPAEVFWDTSIVTVEARLGKNNQLIPGKFILTLSKEVPNDDGLLRVTLRDGRKLWLRIFAVEPSPDAGRKDPPQVPPVPLGQPTKKLYTQMNTEVAGAYPAATFTNAAAQFLSRNFPNSNPKPADSQRTLDLLDQIRIQLNKTNPTSP